MTALLEVSDLSRTYEVRRGSWPFGYRPKLVVNAGELRQKMTVNVHACAQVKILSVDLLTSALTQSTLTLTC